MANPFNKVIYVRLTPETLTVRNSQTGDQVSEPPEAAFETQAKAKLVGVGAEARRLASHPGVKLVKPFIPPRMQVSDFTVATAVLKGFVARVDTGGLFRTTPVVVVHLPDTPEDGYTQVEMRAFREMALRAGARKVTLWQGRALTDTELLSREFAAGGKILEEPSYVIKWANEPAARVGRNNQRALSRVIKGAWLDVIPADGRRSSVPEMMTWLLRLA